MKFTWNLQNRFCKFGVEIQRFSKGKQEQAAVLYAGRNPAKCFPYMPPK